MITKRFDTNNYEYNKKSPLGVYIIHGFSNTTYEVRDLAKFLGKNGFHAVAKNLPGHGTTIEECNRVKYTDWVNHAKQDIAELSSQSKKIYVIGCSMGAVLSLYIASIFPINGLVVAGTVLKFRNPFEVNILVPLLGRFVKISKKKNQDKKNTKFYGYRHYPLLALLQFRKLIKIVLKKINTISCPALIIHSKNDKMSIEENVSILKKTMEPQKQKILIVDHAHHNLFDTNPDQQLIFTNILNFLNSN